MYSTGYIQQPQLGALGANASAIVSSGAGAAASIVASIGPQLIAAGVAANVVPVVGQVLGGIALVAGYLANSYAKTKAIKAQGADVDAQNRLWIIENADLDDKISRSHAQVNAINSEIARLGLSGVQLNGLTDFLKKTFTPAKYEQGILNDKVEQNKKLQEENAQKQNTLDAIKVELERVYDKLTGATNLQKGLVIGGSIAVGATLLYFLNEKFKWVKL